MNWRYVEERIGVFGKSDLVLCLSFSRIFWDVVTPDVGRLWDFLQGTNQKLLLLNNLMAD